MDLKALDHTLRTFSNSERRYKAGHPNLLWQQDIFTNGKIPCLTFHDGSHGSSPRDADSFHVVLPELNISVNRNSRFSAVPMHTHNYIEISYMYSGKCPQTINHTDILLQQGQVMFIDTETPHSVGVLTEDDIMINLLISKEYLHQNLFNHLSKDSILSSFFINALTENAAHDKFLLFHSENNRRISMFFNEFLCECCDPSINSTDIITNLFGLIIAELINVYETDLVKIQLNSTNISVIPIIHYIEANYKTCSRESVARLFHLNEKYLTALLKKHTGMTYKQLVQSQKLKYATKLLKNSALSVTEIANEAGYENVNFFYKKFREEYGITPKEYREQKSASHASHFKIF